MGNDETDFTEFKEKLIEKMGEKLSNEVGEKLKEKKISELVKYAEQQRVKVGISTFCDICIIFVLWILICIGVSGYMGILWLTIIIGLISIVLAIKNSLFQLHPYFRFPSEE